MKTAFQLMLVMLATGLTGIVGADDVLTFEQEPAEELTWFARAQSPSAASGPLVGPPQDVSSYYTPAYPVQTYPGTDPFVSPTDPAYPSPLQDPFSGGTVAPYAAPGPMGSYYTSGINGPQPVQYGWRSRMDFTFLPSEGTSKPDVGSLKIFGADVELAHTKPIWNNWTFILAPQFNYRELQGPGNNISDLPGGFYRLGLDMVLRTPTVNSWTLELGFDPSIATDFRSSINTDGFLLDGHIVGFWQITPRFTLAVGAFYWDRVDDIILPYAGFIWNPNDIWEFRAVFPKPQVSAFLGTPAGIPTWLYFGGEYHVEAYETKPKSFSDHTRVQFADWRLLGGVRFETGRLTSFIEAGYIFGREVKYKSIGTNFDVDDGFIGRVGFRF